MMVYRELKIDTISYIMTFRILLTMFVDVLQYRKISFIYNKIYNVHIQKIYKISFIYNKFPGIELVSIRDLYPR